MPVQYTLRKRRLCSFFFPAPLFPTFVLFFFSHTTHLQPCEGGVVAFCFVCDTPRLLKNLSYGRGGGGTEDGTIEEKKVVVSCG